jgi:nicotinamidase/pyrazinamidase
MQTDSDALLIVDVQRDFLPGGALAVPNGDEVVPVLAEASKFFATSGRPVIASRDWHPTDHCSFGANGGPWPPHCIAGTAGAELDPDLQLPPGTKIVDKATTADKDAYSAFEGTDLDAWLKQQGVRRLYIGGLATEYCVLNTAADAIKYGYDVVLLEDAIRPIDRLAGERAVESLQQMHVLVTKSGDVPDALR